jgi:hypothetical protein
MSRSTMQPQAERTTRRQMLRLEELDTLNGPDLRVCASPSFRQAWASEPTGNGSSTSAG